MPDFSYNPLLGAAYARSFALPDSVPKDQKLFYVDPEADCTNFVSQCIWAAYGGWAGGFSPAAVAENRSRIERRARMTDEWFGSRGYVGSNHWCRVEELYSFCTNPSKAYGPRAEKLAEGAPSDLDPSQIRQGDVIQLVVTDYMPNRYGHNLYVTQPSDQLANILVCTHTYDRLDQPFEWYLQQPEIYARARLLRFHDAPFQS